jgi:transcriptional regulator with XRE-family HTH domain
MGFKRFWRRHACINCYQRYCLSMRAYNIRLMPETWSDFMRNIRRSETETQAQIAARSGGVVDQTTVSRWQRGDGGEPSIEKAVAFARAIGESPIRALIALRYLEPDDITGEIRLVISPAELTDDALLQELSNRLHTLREELRAAASREQADDATPRTGDDEAPPDADRVWTGDEP